MELYIDASQYCMGAYIWVSSEHLVTEASDEWVPQVKLYNMSRGLLIFAECMHICKPPEMELGKDFWPSDQTQPAPTRLFSVWKQPNNIKGLNWNQ